MVHPGQTALLPCLFRKAAPIVLVKVVKEGLQGPGYCFFYRDGQPQESYQHSSFKDRVDLKDLQMKNGDVSVFLRNVSLKDTGTYECIVRYETPGSNDTEVFTHFNNVTVKDAHVQDRGHTGPSVSDDNLQPVLFVLLPLLLLVLVITFFTCFILRLAQTL